MGIARPESAQASSLLLVPPGEACATGQCGGEQFDIGPIGWALAPETVDEDAVWVDDEVAAELASVFGWTFEGTGPVGTNNFCVPPGRLKVPDLGDRTRIKTVGAVRGAVVVDDDGKVVAVPIAVVGNVDRVGESDKHSVDFLVGIEATAHGGCVRGTRQSIDMPMEDEDEVSTSVTLDRPWRPVGVDAADVWGGVIEDGALAGLVCVHCLWD